MNQTQEKELINVVTDLMKNQDQDLIWLNSLCCNVRSVVPESEKDKLMIRVLNALKQNNVIYSSTGFWSLASKNGGHYYPTSVVLTKEFFKEFGRKKVKQLKIF